MFLIVHGDAGYSDFVSLGYMFQNSSLFSDFVHFFLTYLNSLRKHIKFFAMKDLARCFNMFKHKLISFQSRSIKKFLKLNISNFKTQFDFLSFCLHNEIIIKV